jgi:lambda family phage tail tape measure protein
VRKQIAETRVKLSEAQTTAATKSIILTVQETSAQTALARAYADSEIAAKAALVAIGRRSASGAADVGRGDEERARQAEQEALAAQFTVRQAQIQADYRNGKYKGDEESYRKDLTLVIKSEGDQLDALEAGYQAKLKAQSNYQNGAQRALANYSDEAKNTAELVNGFFTNTFKGAEDALTTFVTTGKLNITDFANSVVADLARIIIKQQVVAPLAAALTGQATGAGSVGSFFASLFAGGRATGGPVTGGRLYEINETKRGPGEILSSGGRQYLMANQSGTVSPNNGGGSGGTTVHQTFVLSGAADRRTQTQLAATAGQGVQRALARNT